MTALGPKAVLHFVQVLVPRSKLGKGNPKVLASLALGMITNIYGTGPMMSNGTARKTESYSKLTKSS